MGERSLGFHGMLAAGYTKEAAWEVIRQDAVQAEADGVFAMMRSTPEGLAALECARQAWRRHGMPAPFDDPHKTLAERAEAAGHGELA